MPGHHQITISRDHGVVWKREADSIAELPTAQVHRARAAVVKFDILVVRIIADRVIHQFVDHHFADANARVGRARRPGKHSIKLSRAIRETTRCHAIFLCAKAHGIDHPRLGGVFEIDRLARRAEREVHVRLRVEKKARGGNERFRRNDEFVRQRIIREDAAGEIEGLIAVIVEFDVVHGRVVGVRQEFVDDDGAQRIVVGGFKRARRSADQRAGSPGPRIALTERRPR